MHVRVLVVVEKILRKDLEHHNYVHSHSLCQKVRYNAELALTRMNVRTSTIELFSTVLLNR